MRKNPFPQFFQRSHFLAVLVLLIALPHSLGAQSGKFSSELGLCVPTPLDPRWRDCKGQQVLCG